VVVVAADHGRVDVGEAVDLRGAEEADVDPAGLHPVVEDLRDGGDVVGGLAEDAVADRQRQPRRLGPDRAGLIDEHEVGGVRAPRQVRPGRGQADPHEARGDVAQLTGGGDAHHLVGFPAHSVSSHSANLSVSREIASQAL
jgi:hypothetical protein